MRVTHRGGYSNSRKGTHTMMRTPAGHRVYAMAAEYPSAAALYEAAKRVRDGGFRRWDVYWRLKRAIRDLPRPACANCWNKPAENTSPSSTRTKYVARIFRDFSSVHHRNTRGVRVSWASKHRATAGAFSRHGTSDESTRTSAPEFLCGRAWPAFARRRHGSGWLRNAEAGRVWNAGCSGRS